MKKRLVASVIVSTLAFAAFAQNNEVVAARQDAMETIGKSMKTLSPMAKGEADFDQAAAVDALSKIAVMAQDIKSLFPEDSQTGFGHEHNGEPKETEASPAIWEKRSEFDQLINKFAENTAAAAKTDPQSNEDVAAAMGMFAKDCKACHEDFRIKKD